MVTDTLSNYFEYIGFPAGLNKKWVDGVCYELDDDETLTIAYTGKIYNFFLKSKSPYLIKRFGENKIQNAKKTSGTLAILSFVLFFLGLFLIWIIETQSEYLWVILVPVIGCVVFFFIGDQLEKVNELYKDSKCKKCDRDFAYEEFQKPLIKEVSTHDKYEITIKRSQRCKYCGDEYSIEKPFNYPHKGEINYKEDRACKICENQYPMKEYRKPDIKKINDNEITIRHYKCSHCDYYEITITRIHINEGFQ